MARLHSSRFKKDIRIKPDAKPEPKAPRPCASPNCAESATHRLPRGPNRLNEHLWFCLEHARAHNEQWDYFKGMSEKDIESFRNDAITGHRPTWPLGKRAARVRNGEDAYRYYDHFGLMGDVTEKPHVRPPERRLTRPQLVALEALNLEPSATLLEIKARYKELVKRFHPEANGGDRGAEERLKQVIKAYGVLRASGMT